MKNRNIHENGKTPLALVSFSRKANQLTWEPLGDRVMGGQSDGSLVTSDDGIGDFHGTVRSDNGGGFASVKADFPGPIDASECTGIELLALGDGKTYKVGFRNSTDRRSIVYQHAFTPSSEDWRRVRLPFSEFIPTWRGKTVTDVEPLDLKHLASVSLFVSGRQVGEFRLRMQNWVLF